MAKIKRWERPEQSYEQQRTVRHSRTHFWPVRGMACEECGDQLPPSHPFGVYGSCCVSCRGWLQGGSVVEDGGCDALVATWSVVMEG